MWVLSTKYLGSSSILCATPHLTDSFTWKSITKVVVALKDGFRFRVGKGHISFGMIVGLMKGYFAIWFPSSINIQDINMTISDVFIASNWCFEKLATILSNLIRGLITYD